MDTLANPATSGTLGVNSALVGGISCLCASGLRLRGTLPTQLRELRTTTVILLSRNALTGSLPAAWGQNVTWNSSATPTPGFDSAVLLDLSQNALNSTLPASVGSLGSTLGLGLFDNAFVGTVPPAYTALKWLSLAYNPGLVGALPAGFTGLKLFAWSAYYSGYYSWCDCSLAARGCAALTRPCGQDLYLHKWRGIHVRRAAQLWHQRRLRHGVPLRHGTRYGYRGTLALCLPRFASRQSIGLDRPLTSILLDIKAALDPSGAVLGSWNASQSQPCRPWTTSPGVIGQNPASPGYGGGWRYISTSTAVAGSADYCQVRLAAASAMPAAPDVLLAFSTGLAWWQPGRLYDTHNIDHQHCPDGWHRGSVAVRLGPEGHTSSRASRAADRPPGHTVKELADWQHSQRLVRVSVSLASDTRLTSSVAGART
jgi:hypothetical protein